MAPSIITDDLVCLAFTRWSIVFTQLGVPYGMKVPPGLTNDDVSCPIVSNTYRF